jgi:mannitol/fructose-specific phosphotransferase system IIA component (Ntr-type)
VLAEMIAPLCAEHEELDLEPILARVVAREQQSSTAVGGGLAFPHCVVSGLAHVHVVFGRVPEGADFKARDGLPVKLVVLLVAGEGQRVLYLTILARLSRLLQDKALTRALLRARNRDEMLSALLRRARDQSS